MAVNYEYYRCFYYVAKYKNLTRAAAAMMSSQPNVTRVMHNLEHELGCRLIIRSNRGVSLTEEGERLYRHVAAAFAHLQMGEELVSRGGGPQTGSVYIGASEAALHGLLLDVLRQFHQMYPAVRLKIRNDTALRVLQALRGGQIDFAVVTLPPSPLERHLKRTDLKPFRDLLAGGPSFAELAERPLALEELARHPLISLARDSATFAFYSGFYTEHGLDFDPDVEVATTDLLLPMIENGLGLGFVPEDFARGALEDGRIVRIRLKETIPTRHICLIEDTQGSLSPAARTLRQMLQAARAESDTQKFAENAGKG